MGFVASIKNRNRIFEEDEETPLPDLVTTLLNEEYEVQNVTLRNGKREINLKKDRKGISVQFDDHSGEGNSVETFRQTMDLLKNR
ncbi:MAG: hypothetical protein ACOC87_00905 [Candidatus Natronoplasma sp.]